MPPHTLNQPAAHHTPRRYTCVPLAAGQSPDQLLAHLAELCRSRLQIETDTTIAVIFARHSGLSWEQIAQPMNLTGDMARERWQRYIRPAD